MSIINVPIFPYPSVRYCAPSSSVPTLDAVDEFIFAVFRIPKTGTLNKIGWYCYVVSGTSYTVKVSLETVASTIGQPVATANSGKTLYATGSESADLSSITAGMQYTPINGSSGVSVTAGDLVAVTIRLTAVSSSSIRITCDEYGANPSLMRLYSNQDTYCGSYLGSSWTLWAYVPCLVLEYSDGFVAHPGLVAPATETGVSWNSGSNPDRRGMKFKMPFGCRLYGAAIMLDTDADIDVILYDSDEYTVKSGFPITLTAAKRRGDGRYDHLIIFPTKPEILADTWYRLVILPKSTTNISIAYAYGADDGAFSWLYQSLEGLNVVYTTRNGAPSSSDHTWTDANYKPYMAVLIDGIDTGSGSGISRTRQVMG